ncbi:hypothetical protein ACJRO7_033842 [Eucalyptus globulus]|uniref:tRNA (guanine-N(7)-)-methyltransferase n=1 Tax=Eucalyptus globulus TaxID=34317 RepID=A0ABD3J1S5_EUCGL
MIEKETTSAFNKLTGLPRKRFHRARAHSNPLIQFDYSLHYPPLFPFADIGCGFGGQLVCHGPILGHAHILLLGMEIRDKVTKYVNERIFAFRTINADQYQNISVVRTNSMKYIPNYFQKGQLMKMFFPFQDPHFKEKNHRRRVISPHLLDEYVYTLAVGGITYTITDALMEEELMNDLVVKLLTRATKEGQKVARNGGQTFNLPWLQSFDKVFITLKFSCCNFLGACIFHFRSH